MYSKNPKWNIMLINKKTIKYTPRIKKSMYFPLEYQSLNTQTFTIVVLTVIIDQKRQRTVSTSSSVVRQVIGASSARENNVDISFSG